jgi:hypothetical protein
MKVPYSTTYFVFYKNFFFLNLESNLVLVWVSSYFKVNDVHMFPGVAILTTGPERLPERRHRSADSERRLEGRRSHRDHEHRPPDAKMVMSAIHQ